MKVSCPCGLVVQERLCGAFSGKSKSAAVPVALKCTAACESGKNPRNQPVSASTEPEMYATDLHYLARAHRKYVAVLENMFYSALSSGKRTSLPPCDSSRRLLAIEYARMHWQLRTTTKADAVEGWHLVHIESSSSSHMPRPLLSELSQGSGAEKGNNLTPALGSQPLLRFCGVKGFGDELYEIVGGSKSNLLGIRPGQEAGEMLAFFEKGSAAAAVFRKLTGQEPGQLLAVRGVAGAAGLCVSLEQTLGFAGSSSAKARPQVATVSSRAGASGGSAWGAWGAGAKAKAATPTPTAAAPTNTTAAPEPAKPPAKAAAEATQQEPVLDSWEDL